MDPSGDLLKSRANPKRVHSGIPKALVASVAAVLLLLVCGRAQAYGYAFSTFTGDDAAGMKLSIYTSSDALDFTLMSKPGFGGPSGYLRDPSIMKYVDGKYYVAYTDPLTDNCCGEEDHFSIAWSTDLVEWTNLTTVPAGVPGVAHAWAPEWFVEGSSVYITANIDTLDTDSDFKPYLFTAQDSTLATWSGPVALGFGPNYIDTFVLKVGGTYHAFAKNETTRYCEHATASNLTGPWTFVGTGNWAGWGSGMEGPAVVQIDDGTWRIYMDGQGSTPFVTATSPDLYTWSSWIALPDGLGDVVRQGTVIRDTTVGGPAGDGGTPEDAGALPDAQVSDGSVPAADARAPTDSGAAGDARPSVDSGSATDSSTRGDAREPFDATGGDAGGSALDDAGRGDGFVGAGSDSSVEAVASEDEEAGLATETGADAEGEASGADVEAVADEGSTPDVDSDSGPGPTGSGGCSCAAARGERGLPGGSALLALGVAALLRRGSQKTAPAVRRLRQARCNRLLRGRGLRSFEPSQGVRIRK
jgi:hypothetical protein